MSTIHPFRAIRPACGLASSIAALPYDVYDSVEARSVVQKNPLSFLKIDRAETQLPEGTDMYAPEVYQTARRTLDQMIKEGSFVQDETPCFYVYALTMEGRTQTGLVCCASVDDYLNGIILKHENTLAAKEEDRIRHVDACSAQTGPIFLSYRPDETVRHITDAAKNSAPLYDFVSEDQIRHQVWRIDVAETIDNISQLFKNIPHLYIADGHHRAASAVKAALKRRTEDPGFSGTEEYNYFLSVLFPADELKIYDYNRVVTDKNSYTFDTFLDKIKDGFEITQIGSAPYHPKTKGEIGLYCRKTWYRMKARPVLFSDDPVKSLDVSILQDNVLDPVFGIRDPKTDPRIRFIGGIRGLSALEQAADSSGGMAFAMYPTSMEELLRVADAGMLMPPKSTWFEPKLRSGLFIHRF
ncbi:DUF1015 domain-containing protein [Clostridium sp. Marseille-P3244]|uniref:DUF1015 domain-containing protein n=1 Tax=Clostridium sp. Marseille-P3244 TaxID=1871020 RepID=UPI000931BFE7|nr:DUF1015 family protein [Clostridium sp. Marseille-P3244]